MLDLANLGRAFGPYTVTVEAAPLGLLAAVLGDPSLAVPPTFMTRYGLWANRPLLAELEALGAPLPRLLHGEQRYRFHSLPAPGATLSAAPTIVALEQKSGRSGPFQLLTLETHWHTPGGAPTVSDTLVVVVRGEAPQPAADGPRAQRDAPTTPLPSGTELPVIEVGPLAPALFARYAEASGDHNPLHTNQAFARAAGLPDVIAHGMLVMGLLGRVAAGLAGTPALRELQARFLATTAPGEQLRCGGSITTRDAGGEATVELWARNTAGQLKAAGSATIAHPAEDAL